MRVLAHFAAWCLGVATAQTQTTEAERAALVRHVERRRRLVEIGVWHGVTTRCLLEAMPADAELIAVDPFPGGRLGFSVQWCIARHEVARVRRGRVTWRRMTGSEAARLEDRPVDFIFIDGDHSYEGIAADWRSWRPLVARHGVVAIHDSIAAPGEAEPGSARFTREVILSDPDFAALEQVDSLTMVRHERGAARP